MKRRLRSSDGACRADCNPLAITALKFMRAADVDKAAMNHRGIKSASAGGRKFSRCVAAFMLLLFVGVHLLAASHELHHELHDDADSGGHQCAVTALTNGQVDCASAAPSVPAPVATVEARQIFSESSPALTPCRLLAGRAPPVLA
jgi:hypothetical protein